MRREKDGYERGDGAELIVVLGGCGAIQAIAELFLRSVVDRSGSCQNSGKERLKRCRKCAIGKATRQRDGRRESASCGEEAFLVACCSSNVPKYRY
ncbi:hypothetical protein NDU88_003439 [Pleurodeles waltl]|uniref:Uncharacterized protein n=1 Tax=Pleurodeles waltl TaxID=8319 RepID=A0AAV7SFB9_PLEWA|nr:hypothetical protein NDU88_003439 [Pleurodeles waltl]